MAHTPLTSVFTGLRAGLHTLFVALVALVIGRAIVVATATSPIVIALAVLLIIVYVVGYVMGGVVAGRRASAGRSGRRRVVVLAWLLVLSAVWLLLVWLLPEGAYLVFPLFFLYLHLVPRPWGAVAVVVAAAASIVALGLHAGWSIGGVVGPLVGAGVAILIGLGYQSLAREAAERELLMAELIATRDQLAATEHASGVLAERARLAREIHDTVAQGLSSIQMLLHAAERAAPDQPAIEHIVLARETAAANLADTRRFIRELSPAPLAEGSLAAALQRLAATEWRGDTHEVRVSVPQSLDLPMQVQAALLRIAQGAMANVLQHADARVATISITLDAHTVELVIADDGTGFDAELVHADREAGVSDSFGLTAIRERVDQLGGTLAIETSPGIGTRLTVVLAIEEPA